MSFLRLAFQFTRNLGGRHVLAPAALAALVLLAGPARLQAGKCPPCNADADVCAFNCCVFQNCSSPAGAGCVALCAFGWLIAETFEDGEVGPAFKSFSGQSQADCHGDNRVGVIMLPPAGSGTTTKRIEIGLVSISDRKFLTTAGDVVSVVVDVAGKQDYEASGGNPRWEPIGSASFDTRAAAWVLNWPLFRFNSGDYVLRARATRKDGRVQEARGLALAGSASY